MSLQEQRCNNELRITSDEARPSRYQSAAVRHQFPTFAFNSSKKFSTTINSTASPGKGGQQQKHDRRAAQLFLQLFGPIRKARTLNAQDWSRFISARRSGSLTPPHGSGQPVGNRTVETDLKFLLAVLNWATKVRMGDEPLLAANPLRGLPLPKEKNPRRPVFNAEEYDALREVAPSIDWRFALAVTLCHETGHRIGAVRVLRWSDFDLEKGLVTWQAASDKAGREHQTPLSEVAVNGVKSVLQKNPKIGDSWLFPATRDASKPVSPRAMHMWMDEALVTIGLSDRRGLGFHGLRRKFATELRDIPIKDLMSLGGWKDHRTILQCYQHPEMHELRNALHHRRQSTHQIHSPSAESGSS